MPGIFKMTDTKDKPSDIPVVFAEGTLSAEPAKRHSYKKYAIIAGSCILGAAIILTAILVGMYFFSEAQKDIIKLSYNLNANTKQDVTSDPNTNVVQYHVTSPDYEMWVVNDFNRDIQVMKIYYAASTNCYVAPLNRTIATDPSKVSAPKSQTRQNATYNVNYRAADTTIPDSSFLGKTARDTCKGISTYWVFPSCTVPGESASSKRSKRGWSVGVCIFIFCGSYEF